MPLAETHARSSMPSERPGGFGLTDAVDQDRAVGCGAAEEVAPARVAVAMRPGIEQLRAGAPAPLAELDAWRLEPYRRLWAGRLDALERHLDESDDREPR